MKKPNILFIIVDSLRQDKCLGSKKNSFTPNLDKLIENGIFFEQAISPAPITVPSVSSIFTGLYPYETTNLKKDVFTLKKNVPTFIKTLEKYGYSTYAILPEALSYTNIPNDFSNVEFFNSFGTLYDGIGEKIILKLQNLSNEKPWLMYIHLEDLHGNALFHLSSDKNKIDNFKGKNQYEKMLSAIDPWIGNILKNVNEENTVVILTSDHGSTSADFTNEMFEFSLKMSKIRERDNGMTFKLGHKFFTSLPKPLLPIRKKIAEMYVDKKNKNIQDKLKSELPDIENLNPTLYQKRLLNKSVVYPNSCFDENFRPVLIISGPNMGKNKIIQIQISTIDIFPTIFQLFEIQHMYKIRGRSFLPLLNHNSFEEKPVMIDGASDTTRSKYSDTIGIRTSKYKYFRDRKNSEKDVNLYDLKCDPHELTNIHKSHYDVLCEFETILKQIDSKKNFEFTTSDDMNKDETEKAKDILRDLGYIK